MKRFLCSCFLFLGLDNANVMIDNLQVTDFPSFDQFNRAIAETMDDMPNLNNRLQIENRIEEVFTNIAANTNLSVSLRVSLLEMGRYHFNSGCSNFDCLWMDGFINQKVRGITGQDFYTPGNVVNFASIILNGMRDPLSEGILESFSYNDLASHLISFLYGRDNDLLFNTLLPMLSASGMEFEIFFITKKKFPTRHIAPWNDNGNGENLDIIEGQIDRTARVLTQDDFDSSYVINDDQITNLINQIADGNNTPAVKLAYLIDLSNEYKDICPWVPVFIKDTLLRISGRDCFARENFFHLARALFSGFGSLDFDHYKNYSSEIVIIVQNLLIGRGGQAENFLTTRLFPYMRHVGIEDLIVVYPAEDNEEEEENTLLENNNNN